MTPRYGQRYGSPAMGGGSISLTFPAFGGMGKLDVRLLKNLNVDIRLTEEDIPAIQKNTPIVTGRLHGSYRIVNGNIISTAPYVFVVEQRHGMIEKAAKEVMKNLMERVKKQLARKKPFNVPKPLGTIGVKV